MTKTEYEKIRARIDHRYYTDIGALERIWHEFNGNDEPPAAADPGPDASVAKRRRQGKLSDEDKRARKAVYMKAYLARKKAGLVGTGRKAHNATERGVKNFHKFLVPGPIGVGGNGEG